MSATFTDDDLEKRVENANGEVIGTVRSIEDDTAHVEPRAGVVDSIRAALGWSEAHDDTVAVHENTVDEISSDVIRLRIESVDDPADVPTETGVTTTNATERDPGTDVDEWDSSGSVDAMDDATARNAAERDAGTDELEETSAIEPLEESDAEPTVETGTSVGESDETTDSSAVEPAETGPDEPMDAPDEDQAVDEPVETRASGGSDETHATDEPSDVHRPDAPSEPGLEHTTAVIDEAEEPNATDEAGGASAPDAEDETQASPDAMSGGQSTESAEAIDRAGVDDAPIDEAEPDGPDTGAGIGPTAETGHDESDRSEPAESESGGGAAAGSTSIEGTDLTEELNTSLDLESAAESTESDDGVADDATESDDIADEVDTGVDLESAATDADETGSRRETDDADLADELDTGVALESVTDAETDSRADARPETELDPDVEARSGPETDPRPETTLETADGGSTTADGSQSGNEVVPGVDIESAVEPDSESGPEIDPDTIAGSEGEAESTDDRVARERLDDEADAATADTETDAATADSEDADRAGGERSGSPLGAAFATQRAAMTSGQELLKQGLTVQQRTVRTAVEAPLVAQRQGVEIAQSATQSYFDALAALTGTSNADADSSDEIPQSPDELLAKLEDAAELADDEFDRQVSDHIERLRTMRARLDADDEDEEMAAALLERQVALLEACQQRLGESDE